MQPSAPITTSAGALSALQSAQGSQQSGTALLSGQEAALGVPQEQQQVSGLRTAITNTTNLLNNVAPSVYGRTQNSLETSAQAGAEINNEQAPISQELSTQNTNLTNQESDLSANESKATANANLEETDQQNQLSYLDNLYQNLYGSEQDQIKNQQNEQQIQNSAAAASNSGGLTAAQQLAQSQAASQQQTVNKIQSSLKASAGSDGYVSPQSYAAAASDYVQSGGNIKDFNNYFSYLKNPQNPYYSV